MEFDNPTTYVIRVTAVYKQSHVLAINGEKQTFKNYDIGMFTCKFENKLKMNLYAKYPIMTWCYPQYTCYPDQ